MSSSHYIIVARHEDGRLELPLGDLTIYGCDPEAEAELFRGICQQYDDEWSLCWYQPMGDFYSGMIKT